MFPDRFLKESWSFIPFAPMLKKVFRSKAPRSSLTFHWSLAWMKSELFYWLAQRLISSLFIVDLCCYFVSHEFRPRDDQSMQTDFFGLVPRPNLFQTRILPALRWRKIKKEPKWESYQSECWSRYSGFLLVVPIGSNTEIFFARFKTMRIKKNFRASAFGIQKENWG